jgi:hypothetical protein
MKTNEEKYILIWAFFALFLFVFVFNWIQNKSNYILIKEGYTNVIDESDETSHNVDLPINNTLDCNNMCGPLARCQKTGQQCTSDVDCYGCNPGYLTTDKNNGKNIHGDNDAGKLSYYAPQLSMLTTDIGSRAKLVGDRYAVAPQYDIGVNTWRDTFDEGQKLFDKRYYSGSQPYTPHYPERKTLSGEFIDNGPLASNDYL